MSKPTVFHVDDEQEVLTDTQEKANGLQIIGFTEIMLFSMTVLREVLQRQRMNILSVLSDHNMPGISGELMIQQMNILNTFLKGRNIHTLPFVLMTGDASATTEKFYETQSPYYAGRIVKVAQRAPQDIESRLKHMVAQWELAQASRQQ